MKLSYCAALAASLTPLHAADLVISEFMASNSGTLLDENGDS